VGRIEEVEGIDRLTDLPAVWRVGQAGLTGCRIGIVLVAAAILAAVAWVILDPDADAVAVALVVVAGLVIAAVLWRAGIHPSVTATQYGLVIRNPLARVVVPWQDVRGASAGYDGVVIFRRAAPPVVIWAVQKSNLATWSGSRTRADAVARRLVELAVEHGAVVESGSDIEASVHRSVEPRDAVRRPLRFPWRMTRIEAEVVDFLRHSSSPLASGATAVMFCVIGLVMGGFLVMEQWDAYVLGERGVLVQGTVLDTPGLVKVTWPDIAPDAVFLERGDVPVERYVVGEAVQVVVDPQRPARAQLVGSGTDGATTARSIVFTLGALFLASGYAKWARWLVAARDDPPSSRARHLR
jgi:hypothetical protein